MGPGVARSSSRLQSSPYIRLLVSTTALVELSRERVELSRERVEVSRERVEVSRERVEQRRS